jgi:hypothetical protein
MAAKGDNTTLNGFDSSSQESGEDRAVGRTVPLDEDPEFSYDEQRKIIHRVDKRLVVMAGLMYSFSLLDRNNLPNAAIAGMRPELELNVGSRYVSLKLLLVELLHHPLYYVVSDVHTEHYSRRLLRHLYNFPAPSYSVHPLGWTSSMSRGILC